ncbi:MAG: efflux RND transporter periplasmic adaptor subunit [Flavobacteriales bacterium]|nr:efflux RND transporter periplasmic adaptor subunit [Flavobacteriales bacterium]
MSLRKIVLGAITVAFGVFVAFTLARNKRKLEASRKLETLEVRIPVKVDTARLETWSIRVVKTGTLLPWEESAIMALQPGQVTAVHFQTGDQVREGQLLAETDIRQKELSRQALELALEKLKKDLDRAEKLRQGEALTEAAYLDLKFQKENTEIQLEQVKLQIRDSRITAPVGGIVSAKNLNKGEFVNPGMPLGRISDLSRLKIFCALTAEELSAVKAGDPVKVVLESAPQDTLEAQVRFINPRADQAQNFQVEVVLPNPQLKIKAGGFASVFFTKTEERKVLSLPRQAFGGSVALGEIFIVRDSVAYLKKVTTGRVNLQKVEILSGLQPGETVVLTGQNNLADGVAVRVVK